MLFSKPKTVLWPKAGTLEVYFDRKESNSYTFDVNLWQALSETDVQSLQSFFQNQKISQAEVLIPDDIVLTKSFIYDTKISAIEKKDVIGLAESFVPFKIDPDAIDYSLLQLETKTIIQAKIYDKPKLDILFGNLAAAGVAVTANSSVSSSVVRVISSFFKDQYFLLFPSNQSEYTLILAKSDSVYLTANLKGQSLDIQKIINYSRLYFAQPTTKIFLPSSNTPEISSVTNLEKTPFDQSQIATELKKTSNLPLPVLGLFLEHAPSAAAIIKHIDTNISSPPPKPKMEKQRKNILPIVAVFIFTAALASVLIWFVLNRNTSPDLATPSSENQTTPTETIAEVTPEATATTAPAAEVDKTIKIQVLNATEINGQAAAFKSVLTDLGFKDVTVGNSKETATSNEVRLKPSLSSASAYFKEALDGKFDNANYVTTLKENSTYDAVFVIGVDLKKSATTQEAATPSPTKKATPTSKNSPTPEE